MLSRMPGYDLVIIKARHRDEAPLTVHDSQTTFASLTWTGRMLEQDGLAAPQEVFIHTEVLRARPDVNSVIHIHPPGIVAYTIAEKALLPTLGGYSSGSFTLVMRGLPNYPAAFDQHVACRSQLRQPRLWPACP